MEETGGTDSEEVVELVVAVEDTEEIEEGTGAGAETEWTEREEDFEIFKLENVLCFACQFLC